MAGSAVASSHSGARIQVWPTEGGCWDCGPPVQRTAQVGQPPQGDCSDRKPTFLPAAVPAPRLCMLIHGSHPPFQSLLCVTHLRLVPNNATPFGMTFSLLCSLQLLEPRVSQATRDPSNAQGGLLNIKFRGQRLPWSQGSWVPGRSCGLWSNSAEEWGALWEPVWVWGDSGRAVSFNVCLNSFLLGIMAGRWLGLQEVG